MNVEDIMSVNPVTCASTTRIADAVILMRDRGLGFLPVTDDNRLVGVITDRDILMRCFATGRVHNLFVDEFMTKSDLVAVNPDDSLADAMNIIAERQLRRVPVVDGTNSVIGVLTIADFAKNAKDSQGTGLVLDLIESLYTKG